MTLLLRSKGQNRRAKRQAIHWPTTLVEGDLRRGCTILDASRVGARIQLTAPPRPPARIMLIDDRVGAIEAIVMWCRGDQAGVEFVQPEPAVMARLRALLKSLEDADARAAAAGRRPQFGRRTHHGSPVS
jgi:hypothetical protein